MAEYTCDVCGTKLKNRSGIKAHEQSQKHLSAGGGIAPSAGVSEDAPYGYNEFGQPETLAEIYAKAGASPPLSGEIGALRDKIKFDQSKPWQAVYDAYVKTPQNDNPKSKTIGGNTLKERDVIRLSLHESRRVW